MSIVIISAFLRTLREEDDEEVTLRELLIRCGRLVVFFFMGIFLCAGVESLIAGL